MNKHLTAVMVFALAGLGTLASTRGDQQTYGLGGPLYGVELPLFPTQQGERPGYPGNLVDEEGNFQERFDPGGQHPQRQLYPGSIENFRYYWYHYVPTRSMFDEQSLLKNFLASDLAIERVEEYAAPLWMSPTWGNPRPTGKFNAPVPVVRTAAGDPAFELDLGTLQAGLYVVRVIATVEPEKILRHQKPLFLSMTVNDQLDGSSATYRMRTPYVDEFYSIAEFFFHAPETRAYQVSLQVDDDSMVDVLIHNIDVHDALAGATRRAIKTRSIHGLDPAATPGMLGDTRPIEERFNRDRILWHSLPPLNNQRGRTYGMAPDDGRGNWPNMGAGGLTPEQIQEQYGHWAMPFDRRRSGPDDFIAEAHILARNEKLGLVYTIDDYIAGRPLPDPYPFKDDGRGVFTPSDDPELPGQNWHPIADAVTARYRRVLNQHGLVTSLTNAFRQGNYDAGRDAVILLARAAYDYPALDSRTDMSSVMVNPGPYGRDMALRRRINRDFRLLRAHADHYDTLFPIIAGNQELADSIGRFVPWVKSPDDVVQLFDVYLIQHLAKGYMRYQNQVANQPHAAALLATILGDNEVTLPWMQWTFSRSFTYPQGPSGIQDMLVSGFDRDGMNYIGSTYYVSPAIGSANILDEYIQQGGDPQFSLMDPERYPKVYESLYGRLRFHTAGPHFFRTGSVTGAEKSLYFRFGGMQSTARRGWELTGDPQFAWMLVHLVGRDEETDAQWAEIVEAAQDQRAPWLENRSRVMSNLAAFLESGTQHDDYRFRRSAALRIGQGYGHAHRDTLALQVHAHGVPMVLGGGQRGGYSNPSDVASRVHNLLTTDSHHLTHAWIPTLSDADGARYMRAQAAVANFYERQVALIDVDEGSGSAPLTNEQVKPRAELAGDITSANSYVFDVYRASGNDVHTYNFRAQVSDDGTFDTNVTDAIVFEALDEEDPDRQFLNRHTEPRWAADAPDYYIATYPVSSGQVRGYLQPMWSDEMPDFYTRLHALTPPDTRVLSGVMHTLTPNLNYRLPLTHLQRRGEDLDSTFVAVIEPFVGEPFIRDIERLAVVDNESDAKQAVAVGVNLVDGRRDVLFADGRPELTRRVEGGYVASGEFAYVSVDAQGLRQATLTGGTLLQTPELMIRAAAPAHTATITAVDYAKRRVTLDTPWTPLAGNGRVAQVGTPQKWTQVTFLSVTPEGDQSIVDVQGGADYYLSRVNEVDEATGIVSTGVEIQHVGHHEDWVASNEQGTRFWRADYLGGDRAAKAFKFQLRGDPVRQADFGELGGLYLWEYGVGDTVRQATMVNLQRQDDGSYLLTADVDVEIEINGQRIRITQAQLQANNGQMTLR